MKAEEVMKRVLRCDGNVVDLVELLEIFAAQAETIERLQQEFARMDERKSQHLDTHAALREVVDGLHDRLNDLDEFAGIGGPLEARVKAVEERPARVVTSDGRAALS